FSSGANNTQTFGGNNLNLFFGQGPFDIGSNRNPAARGLLIQGAQVALVKFTNGTFALQASGAVSLLGITGVSFAGNFTVRFNNTGGAMASQTIGGNPLDAFTGNAATFSATGIDLTILGQTLHGDFAFDRQTSVDGDQLLTVAVQNGELHLADGTSNLVN